MKVFIKVSEIISYSFRNFFIIFKKENKKEII